MPGATPHLNSTLTTVSQSSLVDLFDHLLAGDPNRPLFYSKTAFGQWESVSYGLFFEMAQRFAASLISLGLREGDSVAVISNNRLEWVVADFGSQMARCQIVSIYPTTSAEQVGYILSDCKAQVLCVDALSHLERLQKVLKKNSRIKALVEFCPQELESSPSFGPAIYGFDAFLALGEGVLRETVMRRRQSIQRHDVVTLIYTSGTTGDPKGVMLTHDNFISQIEGAYHYAHLVQAHTYLSYLPLSHAFERTLLYINLATGSEIYFVEALERLAENLREVRPTFIVLVPRVAEKILSRIKDRIETSGAIQKTLLSVALDVARERVDVELRGRSASLRYYILKWLCGRLVFKRLRDNLGGRLHLLISGGAALPDEICEFFYGVGVPIHQGYGVTETSPIIAVDLGEKMRIGTVGPPFPGVDIRIASDGEIVVRGRCVMKGYHNLPDLTREAIDADGWYHTGDIGELDHGYLKITDRKKEILVTSGGKNVAPQKIENLLIQIPYIENVCLVGDGKKFISALLVPNVHAIARHFSAKGVEFSDVQSMILDSRVNELIRGRVEEVNQSLAGYETIKKFRLVEHPFSIETGELTPTFKLRRKIIYSKYAPLINDMYPAD